MASWSQQIRGKSCSQLAAGVLLEYETPRVVTLRSYRVGLTYRLVQCCILAYLIGYVFIYTKSYQDFDIAESSVVTKIKGVLSLNISGVSEVWDAVDFVIPPQEASAFFVATSLLYTSNQSQSECPEDAHVGKKGIHCKTNDDCPGREPTPYGNGIRTGRCVRWDQNTSTCEIAGWCPTEIDDTPKEAVLSGFESLTVLVKHHVSFSKHGVKRRNIQKNVDQKYLQSCRFNPDHKTDKLCPIFGIKDIVGFANESFAEIAIRGGIIGFNIAWDCDLDFDVELCVPQYSFRRLDDKDDKIAKGWNFRHAYYHYDSSGQIRRDLIKLWGIRFVFNVNGRAGKFNPANFALNLGSGLGLLGIASIVCEFVLLNCVSNQNELLEQKFTKLEDHHHEHGHGPFTSRKKSQLVSTPTPSSHQLSPIYQHNGDARNHLYGNLQLRPPLATWDDEV